MLKTGAPHVVPKILFLLISDSILIVSGLTITTMFRFLQFGISLRNLQSFETASRFVLVVSVCYIALYYNEVYDFRATRQRSVLFVRLLQALGITCLVLAVLYYAIPELSLGRGIAGLAAPLILAFLLGWRLWLVGRGYFQRYSERVLILGTGQAGIALVREILARPEVSLKVVGFLDENGENIGNSLVNPGIIGAADKVESMVLKEDVDRVVLSLAERRGCTPLQQLLRLKFLGVNVEDVHSLYEKVTGRILLEDLSPSWLILSDGFRKSRFLHATKRASDILFCLLALLVSLPPMGIIAVLIWLETGAPILFRQKRVGMRGRLFEVLKFRSMCQNAEANGPRWAIEGDERVTRVGRFIRKYRLDELPQLFNVLRGEMSLVGPRPEQPHFCALLEEKMPLFAQRHAVCPGITGWAQVKYQYGSSIEEAKTKLEYDLFYIKHRSISLDLLIIFRTTKVLLLGRGAR